jgi:hypothetical protein
MNRKRPNAFQLGAGLVFWATAIRLGGCVAIPLTIPTVQIASESDLRLAHSDNCRTRFFRNFQRKRI